MHGARQRGAMPADAGSPSKAAGSNLDKATSWLATRLLAHDSPLSLLEGGGGGRRLALAGRRP